ncbi:AlpA family transcriptional regulator [Endozoicomonas sp. ONNA2]|uniref:helix-turn-helix transcriptional regulator n=1 Tax=Endozoicomonas sp. ONNA2 TaxID=2828741 RepID=UPI0021485AED|nr:helix-turn-helix domain-containing protein [Endozoicomonas sp. ONNA2]
MSHNTIGDMLNDLFKAIGQLAEPTSIFDINRDELLTMDEVCKRFGITRTTLNNWIKQGEFPEPVVIGTIKRWPTSLINARIYEDNPHLRARENLMFQARRVAGSDATKTKEQFDHEQLLTEARRIAKSEKPGAAA